MTVLAPQRTPPDGPPARTARRVAAAIGLGLLAALGGFAVYAAFVRTAFGQKVDELAMQGADVEHPRLE
ncbi:MAG TPA: phosphoesterase, partial [Catenuloplanes sp.]